MMDIQTSTCLSTTRKGNSSQLQLQFLSLFQQSSLNHLLLQSNLVNPSSKTLQSLTVIVMKPKPLFVLFAPHSSSLLVASLMEIIIVESSILFNSLEEVLQERGPTTMQPL